MKKTSVGLEVEFFTINSEGKLVEKADELLKILRENKRIGYHMKEEISHSVIEMGATPKRKVRATAVNFLKNLQKMVEITEENDIYLVPLGCYPAKSNHRLRKKHWYDSQEFLLGKKNFAKEIRMCGFHFHYSLPQGIVGKKTESIKPLRKSYAKDVFLNQYNFAIAMDPVCITLGQSSPFYEGEYIGKDCRALLYRDMAVEGKFEGAYHAELSLIGSLPNYQFTLEDIRWNSARRKNVYLDMLKKREFPIKELATVPELKFMWGPLRVNKIGTLEYRGIDMNHPEYLFGAAAVFKLALEEIKNQELQVLPSDIGIKEPFKIEDGIVYVPPFSTVKSMELLSGMYGLDNSEVHNYCKKLYDFLKKNNSKKINTKMYDIVRKILDKKKTLSDEILDMIKKNGYTPENVPDDFLRYIASYQAKKLGEGVKKSLKLYSSLY